MTVSAAEQEVIEAILAERVPDAECYLDCDTEGLDIPATKPYDVILCLGPAFSSLDSRDRLRSAFRRFADHARYGTQLIVRRPVAVLQSDLEGWARSYRWIYYISIGELLVFGYGFNTVEDPWDRNF